MFIWVILTSVHSNVVTFAVEKFPPHPSKSEQAVLQPAFDVWDQFRKERDAYVKQRGYDDLKESITWEAGTRTGTGMGSMSGGYFLTESYSVNSVSKADTSIFQEILGYQEQLRIEYANKAEEILKEPAENRERNARFADALVPYFLRGDVYNFAVGAIAGTDRQRYNGFITDSRAYKREIVEYLKDKKAFSSRAWFSTDKGTAELTDLPVFNHRRLSLSESFSRASMDILILLAWNIVLFMTAYVSFLRYDMS